jgi:hypothetical protein
VQIPADDYLPESAKLLISAVLGAGGVAWFRVWLENRRLSKKEFRETLLDRVRELEKVIARMQTRMGNLRVEMAHLEVENEQMRIRLGCADRPTEEQDADKQPDTGDDDGESA